MRLELMRFVFILSFAGLPLLKPFFNLEFEAFRNGGFLHWGLLQSLYTFDYLFVQLQGLESVAVRKTQGNDVFV